MKRTLMSQLIRWKEKENRKPLILKGMGQCGKTHLLKSFGEQCYESVAYFDFGASRNLHRIFTALSAEQMLSDLESLAGIPIIPGNTLIIFDEIQECGGAIARLRDFYRSTPEQHIVCTGAMLESAIQNQVCSLTGNAEYLTLYPLSFAEFLRACNEDTLADFLEGFQKGDAWPEVITGKLATYLNQYYITGGMPAVVELWRNTHSIEDVDRIQQMILDSYELEFAKYGPIKEFSKLTATLRSIPEQLAKVKNKFVFDHVQKGLRAKDLQVVVEWLIASGLVIKVCKTETPVLPLAANANPSAFKLYLADVGLLRRLSKLPHEVVLDMNTEHKEFRSSLAENFILCELLKASCEDVCYWSSGNTAEVDFLVQYKSDVVPIEVKTERNIKSRSLAEYRKKYAPRIAVKTSAKNEFEGDGFTYLPLYAISTLATYLDQER